MLLPLNVDKRWGGQRDVDCVLCEGGGSRSFMLAKKVEQYLKSCYLLPQTELHHVPKKFRKLKRSLFKITNESRAFSPSVELSFYSQTNLGVYI